MRSWWCLLVVVVCLVGMRRSHAECVEASGSGREIQLPSGWTQQPHPIYAAGDFFINASLGAKVTAAPPKSGMCSNAIVGEDLSGDSRPVVFDPRWVKYWIKDGVFLACKDTKDGWIEVQVHVGSAAPRDPAILQMTNAVAEMLEFDVQCSWEPPPAVPAPVVYEDEHGIGVAMAGFSSFVDNAPSDIEQNIDVRVNLSIRNGKLAYGIGGRLGIGLGGGVLWQTRFGAGFLFGTRSRIQIFVIGGAHGANGDRIAPTLSTGAMAGVTTPLAKRLFLTVQAELQVLLAILDSPTPGMSETATYVGPSGRVMLGTRWLSAGAELTDFGEALMITGFAGVYHEF